MPTADGQPLTWRGLWATAQATLASSLEARRIVERASGYDAAELVLHLDEPAPARGVSFADRMVERRKDGEPLQYVLGRWGFRTLDLFIDRRVLIPRPETEVVVEAVLVELRRLSLSRPPIVVDLGTGSGAIALSVAVEAAPAEVWGTDSSGAALAVARANLSGLGSRRATRVRLVEGHWFRALPAELRGRIDVIVSNPPYVAEGDHLPAEVARWEPRGALVSGPSGLEALTEIIEEAPLWLSRPGVLVLEVAPHQAPTVLGLVRDAGLEEADARPDLLGRLRVVVGRV